MKIPRLALTLLVLARDDLRKRRSALDKRKGAVNGALMPTGGRHINLI